LTATQAFSHFIVERSFGSDKLGTLSSQQSGDLAFFDECIRQISNEYETSLIEFDDVLPARSLSQIYFKGTLHSKLARIFFSWLKSMYVWKIFTTKTISIDAVVTLIF